MNLYKKYQSINSCLACVPHCSSPTDDDEDDQKSSGQDGRQKSIKDEQVHCKKTETSQLVQEEKAQSGNVSTIKQ